MAAMLILLVAVTVVVVAVAVMQLILAATVKIWEQDVHHFTDKHWSLLQNFTNGHRLEDQGNLGKENNCLDSRKGTTTVKGVKVAVAVVKKVVQVAGESLPEAIAVEREVVLAFVQENVEERQVQGNDDSTKNVNIYLFII